MCSPTAFISGAGLIIDGAQKASAQKIQNRQARAMQVLTRENAYENLNFGLDALNMQNMETEQGINEQIRQRQLQALKDRSKIMISAGEANVGGSSVERLIITNQMSSEHDQSIMDANLESALTANSLKSKEMMANAQSRINGVNNQTQSQIVSNPWLKEAVGVAPSLYMLYQTHKKG